jgi:hypothetical protein
MAAQFLGLPLNYGPIIGAPRGGIPFTHARVAHAKEPMVGGNGVYQRREASLLWLPRLSVDDVLGPDLSGTPRPAACS